MEVDETSGLMGFQATSGDAGRNGDQLSELNDSANLTIMQELRGRGREGEREKL